MSLPVLPDAFNGTNFTTVANEWLNVLSRNYLRRDGSVRITNVDAATSAFYMFPDNQTPWMARFQDDDDTLRADGLIPFINREPGSIVGRVRLDDPLPATDQTIFSVSQDLAALVGNGRNFTQATPDFFIASDAPSLSIGAISFTIVVWVRLTSKTGGSNHGIVSKFEDNTNEREYIISFFPGADRFLFACTADGGAVNTGQVDADVLGSPNTGEWYMITGVHDKDAGLLRMWVNDVSQGTDDYPFGVVHDGVSPLHVGKRESFNVPGDPINADIARIALYKGRAFTQSDVTQMWNCGFGYDRASLPGGLVPGLVHFWNLDEVSGNALDSEGAIDLTENGTITQTDGPAPTTALKNSLSFQVKGTTGFLAADLNGKCGRRWSIQSLEAIPTGQWVNVELFHNGIIPILKLDGRALGLSFLDTTALVDFWGDIKDDVDSFAIGHSVKQVVGEYLNGDIDAIGFFNGFDGGSNGKRLFGEFLFCDTPALSPMTITDTGPNSQDGTFTFAGTGGPVSKAPGGIILPGESVEIVDVPELAEPLWLFSTGAITVNVKEFRSE